MSKKGQKDGRMIEQESVGLLRINCSNSLARKMSASMWSGHNTIDGLRYGELRRYEVCQWRTAFL